MAPALLWIALGAALATGVRLAVRVAHPGHLRPNDALTGVPTRAGGQRAVGSMRPGDAVAMVDLDGLKITNDSSGHAAGDAELIALARHLSDGVRRGDTVARWGGDEFVVVLRDGGDAAFAVVDRLRASSPTSFSAGVAVHRRGTPDDTLAEADAALLSAKRAGGSRVVPAPLRRS
ncbi:MAG: hypothetical protein QOJ00_616 [Actinomycetota bacterium]|jgi:diguanylate cyclase (GGDEF)-like protein